MFLCAVLGLARTLESSFHMLPVFDSLIRECSLFTENGFTPESSKQDLRMKPVGIIPARCFYISLL